MEDDANIPEMIARIRLLPVDDAQIQALMASIDKLSNQIADQSAANPMKLSAQLDPQTAQNVTQQVQQVQEQAQAVANANPVVVPVVAAPSGGYAFGGGEMPSGFSFAGAGEPSLVVDGGGFGAIPGGASWQAGAGVGGAGFFGKISDGLEADVDTKRAAFIDSQRAIYEARTLAKESAENALRFEQFAAEPYSGAGAGAGFFGPIEDEAESAGGEGLTSSGRGLRMGGGRAMAAADLEYGADIFSKGQAARATMQKFRAAKMAEAETGIEAWANEGGGITGEDFMESGAGGMARMGSGRSLMTRIGLYMAASRIGELAEQAGAATKAEHIGELEAGSIDPSLASQGRIGLIESHDQLRQTGFSYGGLSTGAAAGAAIGSFVPFLGTAIGAIVGGIVGEGAGGGIGKATSGADEAKLIEQMREEQRLSGISELNTFESLRATDIGGNVNTSSSMRLQASQEAALTKFNAQQEETANRAKAALEVGALTTAEYEKQANLLRSQADEFREIQRHQTEANARAQKHADEVGRIGNVAADDAGFIAHLRAGKYGHATELAEFNASWKTRMSEADEDVNSAKSDEDYVRAYRKRFHLQHEEKEEHSALGEGFAMEDKYADAVAKHRADEITAQAKINDLRNHGLTWAAAHEEKILNYNREVADIQDKMAATNDPLEKNRLQTVLDALQTSRESLTHMPHMRPEMFSNTTAYSDRLMMNLLQHGPHTGSPHGLSDVAGGAHGVASGASAATGLDKSISALDRVVTRLASIFQ